MARFNDQEMVREYMDADQGGGDFVDATEPAAAPVAPVAAPAATPAASAPKPTDAMLRGKEISQIQFEGMEPVYQSYEMATRGDPGILLGYKFNYSQLPGYGMVPVYKAQEGRGGERGPPVLLGYEFNPQAAGLTIEDAPKPPEILAREKQFGTTMEPLYASYQKMGPRGIAESDPMYYGPPIGYRFDNGKSQYVNFDASGTYQNTETRSSGGFGDFVLSVLPFVYPPAAPFVAAYRTVQALDQGDPLRALIAATGAGKFVPGLDASTTAMLNNVSTGAKIVQAIESKDPLAIISSVTNLPGVPVDVKNIVSLVNTANTVSQGGPGAVTALLNTARKYGSDVSQSGNSVTVDGTVYDIDNTPAGLRDTPESSMGSTFNAQIANNLREERAAAEEEAIAGTPATNVTEPEPVANSDDFSSILAPTPEPIELPPVTVTSPALPQEEAEPQPASDLDDFSSILAPTPVPVELPPVTVTAPALPVTGPTGNNTVTDSSLPVNPNVGGNALDTVEVTGKRITDEDTGGNRVTDSALPVNPNVGTTDGDENRLNRVEITGKRDQELEPVTIIGKQEEPPLVPLVPAPPPPNSTVTPVVAPPPAVTPKIPTVPKTSTARTPATTAPRTAQPTAPEPTYSAKEHDLLATWLGGTFTDAAPKSALAALLLGNNAMNQENQLFSALRQASGAESPGAPSNSGFYSYGSEPSAADVLAPYMHGGTVHTIATGGKMMASPLMAAATGGDAEHKGSHYVQGAGGGQDDLIPAKLADGEYVLDAEIVAALGDGSNKRGAEILDKWRESIRKHKRSGPIGTIPPKAKSPLAYMKGIK